ncbi:MAG: hypothetical protein LOD92_11130, partial [Bacillales bacterium]
GLFVIYKKLLKNIQRLSVIKKSSAKPFFVTGTAEQLLAFLTAPPLLKTSPLNLVVQPASPR